MNNRKNTILALFLVIGLGILVYFMWAVIMNRIRGGMAERVICTADAMQCPDGSWVGRSGQNCQFVCPIGTSTQSTPTQTLLQAVIGQEVSGLNVKILPLGVEEDSRCPYDVQCVRAGTVRVRVLVTSGLGESTSILTLGKAMTTEVETIMLTDVTPVRESGKKIPATDYRFTFKVTKR